MNADQKRIWLYLRSSCVYLRFQIFAFIRGHSCSFRGRSSYDASMLLAAASLCQRELVRFIRQPHRVIGALATPIVFWLLIGGGMGNSFQGSSHDGGKQNYIRYFFPGTVLMILLFHRDLFHDLRD